LLEKEKKEGNFVYEDAQKYFCFGTLFF